MKVTDLDVRSEVARFALLMEAKLRANDGKKRHWRDCPLQYLSLRLTQERKELADAIRDRARFGSGEPGIGSECADVGNFAMMIADKLGELPELPELGHLQALELKPGDKLVMRVVGVLCDDQRERVKQYLEKFAPGAQILVIDSGAELGVVRAAA